MNIYIKKMIVAISVVFVGSFFAEVMGPQTQKEWLKNLAKIDTQQLLAKQNEITSLLQEYWIDKNGDTRIGDKDTTMLRFSFSRALLDKMTDAQLRAAMDTALVKFTPEQQATFRNMVNPQLDALRDIKQQLIDMRKALDDTAITLGKMINKTQQDVMRLPDQNLKNIISVITDSVKKSEAYEQFTIFSKLRKSLAPEAVESSVKGEEGSLMGGSSTKERTTIQASTKQRVAEGVSKFEITGLSGFVGTALGYGLCRDRHWDIVLDSKGHHFMTEVKP